MAYRNIFIANKAVMRIRNNQLMVNNGEDEYSFPVEDIKSIVIDHQSTTISVGLLAALAEAGVCVITCNSKHLPVLQLLPVSPYCRQRKRLLLQVSQSKPKLKRIWQQIVVAKINNQAKCLALNHLQQAQKLRGIVPSVQSGDTSNREGYAASIYFKALYGADFTRESENEINASLNYGYAIIRSFIAKEIVCEGLEPAVGIHHCNQLNQFNLADDLIEPFRPAVDHYVYTQYQEWGEQGFHLQKAQLLLLLNAKTKVGGQDCSLSHAMELLVQSLIASFENEQITLKLPELADTDFFSYD